ncbi:hypothetical protein ASPNIDRAFT_38518 [Aspergillus niger ATCC 1015]|uniref:Uncharacterized protein n=1 Tax=Aspergillus niger (strain ATCC 1015 / CBS 113.46 / FGSC A1144 / LSHB Ac4 / NCTC 3858a / NRRL 328 / USDA 3528.7) TaxID=380704 RepID=G3YG79_ASPNA|nr:hypothetical protein ASPNIDRAFT_38518 [Aspergillus niger ATCC 1015]
MQFVKAPGIYMLSSPDLGWLSAYQDRYSSRIKRQGHKHRVQHPADQNADPAWDLLQEAKRAKSHISSSSSSSSSSSRPKAPNSRVLPRGCLLAYKPDSPRGGARYTLLDGSLILSRICPAALLVHYDREGMIFSAGCAAVFS